MAYTAGQLLIFILLLTFLYKEMGYRKVGLANLFKSYIHQYRPLFLTGFFYYGALWIDKMVFWYLRGDIIEGTMMKLYEPYDVVVYLTNLMMIPGLVFFVIFSETEFYIVLKKFLDSLSRKPYKAIKWNMYRLIQTTRFILSEQSALQGVVLLLFLRLSWMSPAMREKFLMVCVTAAGIFILDLFLTSMNFLLYIQRYRTAFLGSLVFFAVNTAGALCSNRLGIFATPGVSALTGGLLGTGILVISLFRDLNSLDRIIYASVLEKQFKDIPTLRSKGRIIK